MQNPRRDKIILVTPAPPGANNGNRRTAERWAGFLADGFDSIVQARWDGQPAALFIALHAWRSHESIVAMTRSQPRTPIIVVLTGTDLYRDMANRPLTLESLEIADVVVALQEDAVQHVPPRWQGKTQVIYQSAQSLAPLPKSGGEFEFAVVGHLRAEKDPLRVIEALRSLPAHLPLRVTHIGESLDAHLESELRRLAADEPRYRWIGGMDHGGTREAMRRAHALIHPSLMEGGANVIAEAITAGTPVIASRVSGNIGMLGASYPAYFSAGHDEELGRLMLRAMDPVFYARLAAAAAARAELFAPAREASELQKLVVRLIGMRGQSEPPSQA